MGISTVVPWQRFDVELLTSVIESFVNREGTDYGESEVSLEEKVAQVRTLLARHEAFIIFDGESESVTIVTAQQAKLLKAQWMEEGYDHSALEDEEGDDSSSED